MDFATKAIAVLVAGLTAVGVVHGTAHVMVGVTPSVGDLAFIIAVVLAARLAALLLRVGGSRRGADLLLLASMIGSLAYGVGNHYVLAGPDSVWAPAARSVGWRIPGDCRAPGGVRDFGVSASPLCVDPRPAPQRSASSSPFEPAGAVEVVRVVVPHGSCARPGLLA